MISEIAARKEVSKMFLDFWMAQTFIVEGTDIGIPQIIWEGRDTNSQPPNDAPYVRFTWNPLEGMQGSLAGDKSTRVWDNMGIVSVQCFGPLSSNMGLEIAEYLAIMAKNAYQGKSSPSCVWFRNVSERRVGPSGAWYQYNTVAQFEYSTVR